jgi:hypothetical protein
VGESVDYYQDDHIMPLSKCLRLTALNAHAANDLNFDRYSCHSNYRCRFLNICSQNIKTLIDSPAAWPSVAPLAPLAEPEAVTPQQKKSAGVVEAAASQQPAAAPWRRGLKAEPGRRREEASGAWAQRGGRGLGGRRRGWAPGGGRSGPWAGARGGGSRRAAAGRGGRWRSRRPSRREGRRRRGVGFDSRAGGEEGGGGGGGEGEAGSGRKER